MLYDYEDARLFSSLGALSRNCCWAHDAVLRNKSIRHHARKVKIFKSPAAVVRKKSPVRRAIDRHHSSRVPGPRAVLERGRSGDEARRLSGLLQLLSNALGTGGNCAAAPSGPKPNSQSQLPSMAATLWRLVSYAHGSLTATTEF